MINWIRYDNRWEIKKNQAESSQQGQKRAEQEGNLHPNTTVKTSVTIVSLAPLSGQDREEELRRVDKAGDAVTRS